MHFSRAVAAALVLFPAGALAQYSISYLPGNIAGKPNSHIFALSRNGAYLAGQSLDTLNKIQNYRYNLLSKAYGNLGPADSGEEYAISNDGSKAVGTAAQGLSSYAAIWTGGIAFVPGLANGSAASGVSQNGSVVVGSDPGASFDTKGFKIVNGAFSYLPLLSGHATSTAYDVSADGLTIVGQSGQPCFWDSAGVHAVPLPAGYRVGVLVATSSNGAWSVGWATQDGYTSQLFRYSKVWGTLVFGPVMPAIPTSMYISDNGGVAGFSLAGASGTDGWVWTDWEGSYKIADYLTHHGVSLAGHALFFCNGLSADGKTFVGNSTGATVNEGFIAEITPVVPSFSMKLGVTGITGGNPASGTATFTSAASGDVTVLIGGGAGVVPNHVVVKKGQTSATFSFTTRGVAAAINSSVSCVFSGVSHSSGLVIQPASLTSVTLTSATIPSGQPATGKLTFNGFTPTPGGTATMASSKPALVSVPTTLNLAAQSASTRFTMTVGTVTAGTPATISATYHGLTKTASETVTAATLQSITGSAASIKGGGQLTLAIHMGTKSKAAAIVALASSDAAVAPVKSPVTVPANTLSVTQVVQTKAVTAPKQVTFTATQDGVVRTVTVTLTP